MIHGYKWTYQVALVAKILPTSAGSITDAGLLPVSGRSPGGERLAWGIPWTDKPGRLQPMGSQRVRHD